MYWGLRVVATYPYVSVKERIPHKIENEIAILCAIDKTSNVYRTCEHRRQNYMKLCILQEHHLLLNNTIVIHFVWHNP